MTDPDPDFRPFPGHPEELCPGLRRILAPNPSAMTFRGTNTYVLGTSELAVIDPGPDNNAHLEAILAAVGPGQKITHILVTHAHLDHSPLSRDLAQKTGAPIYAYGHAQAGRRPVMQALAERGDMGGGEGVDLDFAPDIPLEDGARIVGQDWEVMALHTPGHMANHLSFAWNDTLFSGDMVMGWATSMVSPPDGDLTSFMQSLDRLATRNEATYFPGHGAPVSDAVARVEALRSHRLGREAQILAALEHGPATPPDLTHRIYTDIDPRLLAAAARNVLAHLLDLTERDRVRVISGERYVLI